MARIQGLLLAMLVALVANRAEAAHCGSATYACCAGIAKCEEQSAYVTYRRECKTCYKLVPTCVTETVSRPGCKEIEELCVKNVPTTCYKDVVETCSQNVKKTVYKNVACTE